MSDWGIHQTVALYVSGLALWSGLVQASTQMHARTLLYKCNNRGYNRNSPHQADVR